MIQIEEETIEETEKQLLSVVEKNNKKRIREVRKKYCKERNLAQRPLYPPMCMGEKGKGK